MAVDHRFKGLPGEHNGNLFLWKRPYVQSLQCNTITKKQDVPGNEQGYSALWLASELGNVPVLPGTLFSLETYHSASFSVKIRLCTYTGGTWGLTDFSFSGHPQISHSFYRTNWIIMKLSNLLKDTSSHFSKQAKLIRAGLALSHAILQFLK